MSESFDGKRLVEVFADPDDEFAGVVFSSSGCGKGLTVLLVYIDPFLYGSTELSIDLGFIVAVDAAEHKTRTCADIALILLRPFHNLDVLIACLHFVTSRIAFATSRSWCRFASREGFPLSVIFVPRT